jgi:hypothetical protein
MEMNYDQQESNGKKTLWIIGGIILVVMIVALIYGATQKSLKNADLNADSSSLQVIQSPAPNSVKTVTSSSAVLGDSEMIELPVTIKTMDVVNLQRIPQEAQVRIGYSLLGECGVLDTPVVAVTGKVFKVTLTAHALKDAQCNKVVVPGEIIVNLPIEGIPAGKYSVRVGKSVKSLTLVADNQIQYSGDK